MSTAFAHAVPGGSDLLNKHVGLTYGCIDGPCVSDGATDNSAAIQNGLNDVAARGGGTYLIPRGNWGISYLTIPANVTLEGKGPGSNLLAVANPPTGKGLINTSGSGASIHNLSITGRVTTPTTLNYSAFSDHPEDTILSANSSVVVTGGSNFRMNKVWLSHTGGYAVWLDARSANIDGVLIDDCYLSQCRPHLFTDGTYTGGAWTGGIYYGMDGITDLFSVRGLRVNNVHFRRMAGNCIWGHSLGFNARHQNVLVSGCTFQDIGLDCVQHGNVSGGGIYNCNAHRVGYITHTDSDTPTPAFVPGHWAVAFDSSGFVSGCTYSSNTGISVNGEIIDLDGFRDGVVANNICIVPDPTDLQYTQDAIASYGPGGSGNFTVGIQTGNTSQNGGGENVAIANNFISGCGKSAIILAYAKGSICRSNRIKHPSTATDEAIQIFSSTGATVPAEWLSTETVVQDNSIDYSGSKFCIRETGSGWNGSLVNRVFGNHITGSNNGEVLFAAASGSMAGLVFSTADRTATGVSQNIWQREGFGSSAAYKLYSQVGSTRDQILQLGDVGPILNVSTNGDPGSGAITTGPITSLGFYDAVATRRVLSIGGFIGMKYDTAFDTAADSTTLDAASMNPATWALLRYNPSVPTIEYSVATDSGANRIWQNLVSTPTVAGSSKQVQFNNGGSFGASSNLTFDTAAKQLTVLGTVATATIVAGSGYVQSDGGFLVSSSNTAADSIQTSGGVKAGLGQFLRTDSANPALIVSPDTNASWVNGFGAMYVRRQGSYTGSHLRFVTSSIGAIGAGAAPGINIWGFGQDTNAAFSPTLLSIDPINLRVGIGTPTPGYAAHIKGAGQTDLVLETTAGTGVSAAMSVTATDIRIGGISNHDVSFYWDNTVAATIHLGVFSFAGLAANPGLKVAAGYIDSAEGFNTASTASNCIQALSGGAWAKLLTTDTALYPKTLGSPPAAPGGGYGGFYHRGGSQFGYYDAGAWHSVDFAASGTGIAMTQDVRNFGVTCNGTTDDTAAWNTLMAGVSGPASFYVPSISAIRNANNLSSTFIPGCPGSPYAFAIPSNVTLWGPGGFLGLDAPNSYESTTQILVSGALDTSGGAIVTSGSAINEDATSFSLTNSYAVDQMLLLSNFPTDAGGSDNYTLSSAGTRNYANTGPNNLRQTRRMEPCQVEAASGGAFSLYAPVVYQYTSTQGLQFQRVLPVENVRLQGLNMTGVYLNVTLARNFSLVGGHYTACTLNVDRSMIISAYPTTWDMQHLDSTVAFGTGTRFFTIYGNYFGGSASADNAAIRLDQCSNGIVDAVVDGQVSGTAFYASIVDGNFAESYYGMTDLPNVNLDITLVCSNATHSVLLSADPWRAPAKNCNFRITASGSGCQFQAGGLLGGTIEHSGPDGNLYILGCEKVVIGRGNAEYIYTADIPDVLGINPNKQNIDLDINGFTVFPKGSGPGSGYPAFQYCLNLKLTDFNIDMTGSLDTSGQAAIFNNVQNVDFGQVRVSRTSTKVWGNVAVTGIIRVFGDLDGVNFSAGWPNPICVVPVTAFSVDGGPNFPAFVNWQTDTTSVTAKGFLGAQNTGGGAGEIAIGSLSNHPVAIKQFNATAIYVNTGRFVGITTLNPIYLFHVYDGAARGYADVAAASLTVTARLSTFEAGAGGALVGTVTNHAFSLRVNDNDQIKLTTDGATVFLGHSTAPSAPGSTASALYSDNTGTLFVYNRPAGAWNSLVNVTSLVAGTGVSVSNSAGANTIALNSSADVAFHSITGRATTTGIAFQTDSPFNFQVDGNGTVSCQALHLGGSNCIDSSRNARFNNILSLGQLTINGRIFMSFSGGVDYSGVGAVGLNGTFNIPGGFTVSGVSGTFHNLVYTNGGLTNYT